MISPEHLTEYLRSHSAVSAAVGTVSGGLPISGEMTDKMAALMPRRAIVVTALAGPEIVGVNHDLAQGRMDVRCYGKDVADAWGLNDAVYAVLRYERPAEMNGKRVVSLYPSGGGAQDRDTEIDAPFVWSEWTLTISEGR